jgi:hypothetical protein
MSQKYYSQRKFVRLTKGSQKKNEARRKQNRCRYNRFRLYYCQAIYISLSELQASVITSISNDEVYLQELSYIYTLKAGPSGRAV